MRSAAVAAGADGYGDGDEDEDEYEVPLTGKGGVSSSSYGEQGGDQGLDGGGEQADEGDSRAFWGPIILLGPILPAIVAMTTVVLGSIILHANPIEEDLGERCGYPLDKFLSAAIATSFILLLIFSWSFLGFDAAFTIRGRRRVFLRPFGSLKSLAIAYGLVFLMALAVWCYGSWAVAKGGSDAQCVSLNGALLRFTSFLVIFYWIGMVYTFIFFVGVVMSPGSTTAAANLPTVLQKKGAGMAGMMKKLKGSSPQDAEEAALRSQFRSISGNPGGTIPHGSLERLLGEVGVMLSGKELKAACEDMDPDGEGEIAEDDFIAWWRSREEDEDSDDDDEDDEEDSN